MSVNSQHYIIKSCVKLFGRFALSFGGTLGILSVLADKTPYAILKSLTIAAVLSCCVLYIILRYTAGGKCMMRVIFGCEVKDCDLVYWGRLTAIVLGLLLFTAKALTDSYPTEDAIREEKARTLIYNEVYFTGGVGNAEAEIRNAYTHDANIKIVIQDLDCKGISEIIESIVR